MKMAPFMTSDSNCSLAGSCCGGVHRVFPAFPPTNARDTQVLPVLHPGLQGHLRGQEGGDRRAGREDEHRSVIVGFIMP